ncbi:hypothetical protein PR048_006267 [Dryococelus australis]|uniref:DUF7869 domain-containing protein n=1 Tax=Dryococelus australis TaxID=614101 RepID=A0ABQ9IAI8_9NEOP|nr:hypothetical protein PR048_006267 [Dryococelus australis]
MESVFTLNKCRQVTGCMMCSVIERGCNLRQPIHADSTLLGSENMNMEQVYTLQLHSPSSTSDGAHAAGVDNGSKAREQGNFDLDKSVHLRQYIIIQIKLQLLCEASFQPKTAAYEDDACDYSDIDPNYAPDDGQNKAPSLDSDFSDIEVNTDCATAVHKKTRHQRKINGGLMTYTKPNVSRRRRSSPCKQKNKGVKFHYYVPISGRYVEICKSCFLRIFAETPKFIWAIGQQKQKSPGSSTTPDKRAHHEPPNKTSKVKLDKESIKKYLPPHLTISELHKKYCEVEDKPVIYTIFSKLFSEADIAIKNPKNDTCRTCDEVKMKLMHAGNDEQISLKQQQDLLHNVVELAYQVEIADKHLSKTDNSMTVLTFDLHQCLPTPSLQTSEAFYERQLWTISLTVHSMKNDQVTCFFLWYESMSRRGANEIASCVCREISNLPDEIKHVVLYSDSCPGQNKNTPFLAMCIYVVHEKKIDMLNNKFMFIGHSRMECDSDHAVIEKAKKYSTQISHPHDGTQLIRMAGKKKPFNVIELTQEYFYDYASLLKTDIQMRKSNEDGEKVVWQTSLKEEDTFSVMDMTRRQQPHPCLKPNKCYNDVVPISEEKKKDILSLLPYILPVFHELYKNLKTKMD